MGLRAAEDHAPAAYAASRLSSQPIFLSLKEEQPLQQQVGAADQQDPILQPPLLEALSAAQGCPAVEADLEGLTQHMISKRIDEEQLKKLHERVDPGNTRERARLASLSLAHSGDWLTCAPVRSLGLHLRPPEFVLAAKYRLGLPIYQTEGPCPACLRPMDKFGDHALSCCVGLGRVSRHNSIRDALFDTAVSAGLNPKKEGRFLIPGVDRRPADILIPHWHTGLDAALDVTITNSLQTATVEREAEQPGFALSFAFDRKIRGVAEDCQRQGLAFIPIVGEALGGLHDVAVANVRKLANALSLHTGQDLSEVTAQGFRRVAMLLQRGNAQILGDKFASYPASEIDGIF